MGLYEKCVLPRIIDWVLRGERFNRLRERFLKGVGGRVLEVGFGSGLNLPYYPSSVTHLYALDPSLPARRLAGKRIQAAPFPVEFVEMDGWRIALPGRSVDTVVSAWTLCTLPDPVSSLKEIRRVLKPEGRYYFLEHGLSPDPCVARLQNLWNPIQKIIGGGCHVNRPIDRLITDSGLALQESEKFYMEGPSIFSYLYRGFATPKQNK